MMCVLSAGHGGKGEGGDGRPGSRNICRAGEEEGTAHSGRPGPARAACSVLSGPGAQGRDPSCPPPAGTHNLGVVIKAALRMDSVGDSTSTEIFLYQMHSP